MITEICVGVGILLLLLIMFYIIFLSKSFNYSKKTKGDVSSITVVARKNLASVSVVAGDITFERKRIIKGQFVEFDYPSTKQSVKLIVEEESGRVQTVAI
ncbi:hypothetical protein KKB44_02570 [Candidatus Micrarchaeota archaeon]|nr:hypothetical protein [Candidatus Micrarchaeota archaeon]